MESEILSSSRRRQLWPDVTGRKRRGCHSTKHRHWSDWLGNLGGHRLDGRTHRRAGQGAIMRLMRVRAACRHSHRGRALHACRRRADHEGQGQCRNQQSQEAGQPKHPLSLHRQEAVATGQPRLCSIQDTNEFAGRLHSWFAAASLAALDQPRLLQRCADEAGEQGMWLEGPALQFGMELDADEPGMVGPFDDFR